MPFISFSCLVALAVPSSTMLNRSDEHGHACFVTDLRGELSVSLPLSIKLVFHRFPQSGWGKSLCGYSVECWVFFLSWKGVRFCQMLFLLCWEITWLLSFIPLMWLYTPWFACVEQALYSWDRSHVLMVCHLFTCCWICMANILLKLLCLFISTLGPVLCLWNGPSLCGLGCHPALGITVILIISVFDLRLKAFPVFHCLWLAALPGGRLPASLFPMWGNWSWGGWETGCGSPRS